jgi:hypothetical protein
LKADNLLNLTVLFEIWSKTAQKTVLLLQRYALRRKVSAKCCLANTCLRDSETVETPQGMIGQMEFAQSFATKLAKRCRSTRFSKRLRRLARSPAASAAVLRNIARYRLFIQHNREEKVESVRLK